MHKILRFSIYVLAGLITACATPPVNKPAVTETIPEAITIPSTLIAPTITNLPATETQTSSFPVVLTQIHMVDDSNGWGATSAEDGSTKLLRTSDAGGTWVDVSPEQPINPYNEFFLDSLIAWVQSYDPASGVSSVLRTTDGGKTWSVLPTIEYAENAIYHFSNRDEGFAQTAGLGAGNLYVNLFETDDGGASWNPILVKAPKPEPDLPTPGTVHLCSICGDSLYYDTERIVITYGDLASEPAGVVRLAVSTDLGNNWNNLKLPLPDKKYASGSVAPISPTFFGADGIMPVNISKYAADSSLAYSILVLYSSNDGGQSWTAAPGILENDGTFFDVPEILSLQNVIVRCGQNLCSTSDGGQSWQTLSTSLNFDSSVGGPDYVYQFDFIDASNGWAVSGEGETSSLWKTTDGGMTWMKLAPVLTR